MKIKNIVFAIEAAPTAIPVKPNIAAISAITKNANVHFNIEFIFGVYTVRQIHYQTMLPFYITIKKVSNKKDLTEFVDFITQIE